MSFLAITGLINFLSCTSFGAFVLINNPRNAINRSVFYINASLVLYSAGYFFWQLSRNESDAMFWFKVLCIGIIFIQVTLLHYTFALVGKYKQKKKELVVYYFINGIFIILNIASLLYAEVEPRFGLGFWPVPTFLFHVYLAFWCLQGLYIMVLLINGLRYTKGKIKEQIKYTIAAACISLIGGSANWLVWYSIPFPPYPNIFVSAGMALMAYATIRYQLMDIKIVLTRTGIFLVVYSLVLGLPFVIGFYTNFGFLSFLTLFILATLGPILYRYLQEKADNIILAQQREYQRILHESAVVIFREHNLNRLLNLIIYGMRTIIKVDYAAVFLDEKEESAYKLKAASSYKIFHEGASLPYTHRVIEIMKSRKRPIMQSDIVELLPEDTKQHIQLIIPSFIENRLLGFLVMGEKMDKSLYTKGDLQTFDILSHQTALAIENCLFMEQRKKTQERLFQAEKLAFIGGMAEGLAHQVRNRLNHFSLATRQLQSEVSAFSQKYANLIEKNSDLKMIVESVNEIGESIIDNVKRTDGVIQGVLNYTLSEDKNNYFTELSFRDIVDGAIDLAKIKHGIEELPITLEIESDGTIYGIMSQMMESMYTLIDNSYDAIEEKRNRLKNSEERKNFQPIILIRLTQNPDSSLIEITDNGIGISEDDKQKVFAPYFTTKSSYKTKTGSGIGLYVVHRIVEENHKGKIWFTSNLMEGTSFYFTLPIHNIPPNAGWVEPPVTSQA
jgi:signal transduction histidine kinase